MYVNIFSLPECCDVSLETVNATPCNNTDNISYSINNLKIGLVGGCLPAVFINHSTRVNIIIVISTSQSNKFNNT